jgi:oligosaccharide reducing-end xylanase
MRALALAPFLLGLATTCCAGPALPSAGGPYRDLFQELLGKDDSEVDAKIAAAWNQFAHGDPETQRLLFPVDGGMAYIPDIANNDVRTEGLSYGMMICVQLDRQHEFNQIWKWAKTHLCHADGPMRGYFGWHASLDGRQLDPGPASDGEEWFVASLFFAAHRWGPGPGIFAYEREAQDLLRTMLHKSEEAGHDSATSMFDPVAKQIVFVPHGDGAHFTDPSYQLPAFYELWARWAASPEDRAFLAAAARESRELFRKAADAKTGLMPDFCEFDGRPHARRGDADFRFDAWRTLSNPALDYSWFAADPHEVEQSNRVLRFLSGEGRLNHDRFKLDGAPIGDDLNSPGLISMAATAGLAADRGLASPFVDRLWKMAMPAGHYRYYNGMLYFIALLETSGRFKIYGRTP